MKSPIFFTFKFSLRFECLKASADMNFGRLLLRLNGLKEKFDRSCGATHLFLSFHPIEPFGRLAPSPDSFVFFFWLSAFLLEKCWQQGRYSEGNTQKNVGMPQLQRINKMTNDRHTWSPAVHSRPILRRSWLGLSHTITKLQSCAPWRSSVEDRLLFRW